MQKANLKWLWLTLLVALLDQASKQAALQWLVFAQPRPVLPGLNLTLVYNTGAAFSFLRDAGGWQRYFFIVLTIGVSIALLLWLSRLPPRRAGLAAALALVLGGAAGNLWDRLQHGYVIDFIQLYWDRWFWPVFNVADSAITVGAALLVIDAFRSNRDEAPA